ncbi:MAG TPA: DNA gyrase inhibitor YacG [Pyrinomonadaceae bacterium]|nr:DNA gyrase inhibitor YacG [Pyrinomonadaceae bacterium]
MKCPTCGKSVDWKDNPFRPFCSERCQLVDLGRWVEGEYRVPGESVPHEPTPYEPTEASRDESEDRE